MAGTHAQACIFRHDISAAGGGGVCGGGLPQPLAHMPYALITDLHAPGALYAGLSGGEIWYSGDRGESWQQLPVELGAIRRALVML